MYKKTHKRCRNNLARSEHIDWLRNDYGTPCITRRFTLRELNKRMGWATWTWPSDLLCRGPSWITASEISWLNQKLIFYIWQTYVFIFYRQPLSLHRSPSPVSFRFCFGAHKTINQKLKWRFYAYPIMLCTSKRRLAYAELSCKCNNHPVSHRNDSAST